MLAGSVAGVGEIRPASSSCTGLHKGVLSMWSGRRNPLLSPAQKGNGADYIRNKYIIQA